jgi:hypothetical protein
MFAFSLGPLTLEELEALEAKERQTKSERPKAEGKTETRANRKPKSTRPPRASKR